MNLEWLDGLLLGDAGLYYCSKKNHSKAYVILGSAKKDWTEYGMSGVAEFQASEAAARTRRGGIDWVSRTYSYPELAEQRKRWYPDGTKHIPADVRITPTSLRLFYLGDGNCRQDGCAWLGFATCDFSRREQAQFLVPKFAALGLDCKLVGQKYPRLAILSDSVRRFFDLIGRRSPVPSYDYKFNPPSWIYETRSRDLAKELGCSVSDINNALTNNGRVTKVDGKFRTFDQGTADFVRLEVRRLQAVDK